MSRQHTLMVRIPMSTTHEARLRRIAKQQRRAIGFVLGEYIPGIVDHAGKASRKRAGAQEQIE